MIATKEKMVDLRVRHSGASCIEIELSNRRIFRHNKHYNAYILDFKQASLLARRLLQVPAVGHNIAEQLTWAPYRVNGEINAPKETNSYFVTVKVPSGCRIQTFIRYFIAETGKWIDSKGMPIETNGCEVLAWRALPYPYVPEEDKK